MTEKQNAIYDEVKNVCNKTYISSESALSLLTIERLDMIRESLDRVAVQLEKLDPLREDPNLDSFGNPIKSDEWE